MGQSFAGHRVRFSENIGYIRSGDPDRNNIKLLDRRDQLMLNGGVEVSPHQKVVLVGEVNGTVYVGSGTPNLNPINPVDAVVGLRYFAWDGKFELGAGYRRLLNGAEARTIPGIPPGRTTLGPVSIGSDDVNGFVFNVAFGRRKEIVPPPPPNRPPSVFLDVQADKTTVQSGERVNITARAMDPDNDVLDYSWLASAGQIIGSGPSIILDTTGLAPGDYTVTVTVDDKKGGTASNSTTIRVAEAPPPPPAPNRAPSIRSVNCNSVIGTALVPGQITDGETVRISASASDPDGDPLSYRWSATAGQIRGSGSDVTLDTTGVTAGPGEPPVEIAIMLTVSDDKGETDTSTCRLTVRSVKKPEVEQVQMDLEFPARGARVDNVHKAILDDIALRLQQEPDARLLIYGHADARERPRLAQQRADNVVNYLVKEKGIDQGRLLVRTVVATESDPANRRVEMWIVPPGADIPQ
jgi:outer membrane protein OmpA-like peptidoglycan-associated protein